MAAASYYQLDSFNPSDPQAPSTLYMGNTRPKPPSNAASMISRPGYHRLGTSDNHPLHPINPPSKPLTQSTIAPALEPLRPTPTPNARLRQRKYQQWKRYLRILSIITQVITAILSGIILAIMLYTLITYQRIKPTMRDGRNAWPKDAKVWPTYMCLAGAGLTVVLSIATLISYCLCFENARRSWKLTIVKYVIHIVAWVTISVLYRYEKSLHGRNNDLWGWSCSQVKTHVQEQFRGVVDFAPLCSSQVRRSF